MAGHLAFVKLVAGRAATTATTTFNVPASGGLDILHGTKSGNTLIACVAIKSTTITLNSVADDRGNTWVVDYSPAAGTNSRVFFASCLNPVGLRPGDTVTFTFSASTSANKYVSIIEVGGVVSASALDKTAAATGNSTTPASGATAALAQNDELAMGVHVTDGVTGDTLTDGGGFTTFDTEFISGGKLYSQYQILTAGGTPNAQGTLSGAARNWASAIGTYKASTTLGQRVEAADLHVEYGGATVEVEAVGLSTEYGSATIRVEGVYLQVEYALDGTPVTGGGVLFAIAAM